MRSVPLWSVGSVCGSFGLDYLFFFFDGRMGREVGGNTRRGVEALAPSLLPDGDDDEVFKA